MPRGCVSQTCHCAVDLHCHASVSLLGVHEGALEILIETLVFLLAQMTTEGAPANSGGAAFRRLSSVTSFPPGG